MPLTLETILAPSSVLGSFFLLFLGGLLFYPVTSGTSFLYYRVFRRDRYFASDQENLAKEQGQRNTEWLWAFYNVLGNAVLTAPIHHWIVTGKSRVYTDVADYGYPYLALSVVLVLLVTEPAVYWAHRILHHPYLYKRIHLHHHQFRVPSPWTSMAFHPLDSFMQAVPHHLCAFLFPMHAGVYLFFIMFLQLWSTFIHERVTFVRWGFINHTAHHTLHHKANKYNYGQFFTVCDRIFGTWKDPWGLVFDGAAGSPPKKLPQSSGPVVPAPASNVTEAS